MIIDKYECHGCDGQVPTEFRCKVVIPHTDNKLPQHLKGKDKFKKRVCICDNNPDIMADWQKVEEWTEPKSA